MSSRGQNSVDLTAGLAVLKALAESTRLRIVLLLAERELTVKDLTTILGQSQPRISRHLKLLHEAGVIERYREGSWVYFRLSESGWIGSVLTGFDRSDAEHGRDLDRLALLRAEQAAQAQTYFERNAGDWDRLRSLYVDEQAVDSAISDAVGAQDIELLVDLGTGTGRVLELLAGRYQRALGIDINKAMLNYARARLDQQRDGHAQVRHGDLYNLSMDDACADLVVMHQVLHYLSDPAAAIREAGRILKPGGRLLVVDFAPHDLDYLREEFAHQRLGFGEDQMAGWLREAQMQTLAMQTLAPSGARQSERLTVALWTAQKMNVVGMDAQRASRVRQVERAR
ncbi:MAG: metalloregulator ArsR/SmtB family transcription factor [Pseudomonadota bacterium]